MEIYSENNVEALVFHGNPNCKGDCPGCYLKPHIEISRKRASHFSQHALVRELATRNHTKSNSYSSK